MDGLQLAISMPGPMEWAIIAVVALIVFGPKRLPELGQSVGKMLREFKKATDGSAESDSPVKVASIEGPDEEARVKAENENSQTPKES